MRIQIRKLKNDENDHSCKKSKGWLLTLKSQTLTDNIFKCDFNFEKIMLILVQEVKSGQDGQNDKKSMFDFDLNGEMTIFPHD